MTSQRRLLREHARYLKRFARDMAQYNDDQLTVLAASKSDREQMEKVLASCEETLNKYGDQVARDAVESIRKQMRRVQHALNHPGILA